MQQQDAPENSWSNGVTIKKTRDGYSWTVAVSANSNSAKDLQDALDKAMALEEQLATAYGENESK